MKAKKIGLLGFDGVMALDLVGPVDAFTSAEIEEPNGQPSRCYEVVIIGFSDKSFVSESGVVFKPHKTMSNAPALDTLILPGGKGLRVPETQARVAEWIKNRINRIRRVATVCTGAYGLAATGLLDGRCVTTHWRYALDLARRFPKLKVNPNALYLKDGKFYTGAGITAGIDLSLALIEEDFGPRVALAVARELVVYLKRPGGQEQFSEPLRFQVRSSDRFAELAAWIQGHLQQDLSAESLANRACLSPRHFSRRFKDAFGSPPAAFVEGLRLSEARERLTLPDQTIESVADSVGFKSADAFRRAFERRFGIAPSNYRKNFAMRSES
jgi:transcriptional regulator GlxA family with amidase domain